jgi:D-3-phosphoglycerate dehydrogenase
LSARRPRVLVREAIAPAGVELLRSRFDVDEDTDAELEDVIGRYDAIVVRSGTQIDAALLEHAVVVANAPESTIVSATEHALGLMLALSRNIPQAHAAVKSGRWERAAYAGHELQGKTLVVLGFGRIGQQLARRALGLGMRVVAVDPYVAPERFRELGVEQVAALDAALGEADFLSLHLPLTDETRHLLDAHAFAALKGGARLVNTARGELVDEQALLDALSSGKIAAAGLDVFSTEPYTGPLLALDNVVVTPHLAASTEEAQDRAGLIVAEQVVAALDGGLVTNAVNSPVVRPEELEVLGPFVPLAESLGRLAMELARGGAERIEVSFEGRLADHDTRLLTAAALKGAFDGRTEQPVNYVNAPLVAAERGIRVEEGSHRSSRDFTSLVEVAMCSEGDEVRVAATTIGVDDRHWLVGALGYQIEMELAPLMVFFLYDDRPGVIGKVGTLFGEAGINIANMAVSRTNQGGKALMALSIDSPAPPELVDRFLDTGFDDALFIRLTPDA